MPFKFNPFTDKLDIVDTTVAPGPVLTLTGNSGPAQSPVAGNINLLGGTGIKSVGTVGTLTFNLTGNGFTWSTVTSATNVNPIVVQNAYVTGGALTTIFLLPAAAAVGDTFIITGLSSLFQINQNALQTIILGSSQTTVGGGGSLTSTSIGDHLQITCIAANTTFKAVDVIGNITII